MMVFGSIILIAGIAIGSASTVILMPPRKPLRPDPDPAWFTLMMSKRLRPVLNLTPEQSKDVEAILKTTFQKLDDIRKNAKGPIDDAVQLMDVQIRAVLTEEQRARWQREFDFRGPGGRPGDPNRPWRGFDSGDPNRFREGFRRGPGRYGPGDPNRPPGDFDREAMRERYRRGDGSFDRRPRPEDRDRPPAETTTEGEKEGE
ncbi:MAG: hypothetical protein ACYS8Z_07000 [Planctomycetota bacterium]|jgi:hypothetical protein